MSYRSRTLLVSSLFIVSALVATFALYAFNGETVQRPTRQVAPIEGASVLVPVSAPGFSVEQQSAESGSDRIAVAAKRNSAVAPFEVEAPLSVSGLVVVSVIDESTGLPAQGAAVRIGLSNAYAEDSEPRLFEVETNEAGLASVDVGFGALNVCAFTADGRFARSRVGHGSDSSTYIELELEPLATVSGIVIDRASGQPIAGARLSNHVTISMGGSDLLSKEDGTFEFDLWGVSSAAVLTVKAEGYGVAYPSLLVDAKGRWTLFGNDSEFTMNDTVAYVEVLLEPEQWISGRVIRSDGTAVAGASVRALGTVSSSFFILVDDVVETLTGEDGAFLLKGLRLDVPHLVVCESSDEYLALRWASTGDISLGLGQIVLSPSAGIEGSIHDASGSPLAGSSIRIEIIAPSPIPEHERSQLPPGAFAGFGANGQVASDGNFSMKGLVPGRAEIIFEAGGDELARRTVELVEGQRVRLDAIVIELESTLIEAVLTDRVGSRLANRTVALVADDAVLARTQSNSSGEFAMAVLREEQQSGLALVLLDASGGVESRWLSRSGRFPEVLRVK